MTPPPLPSPALTCSANTLRRADLATRVDSAAAAGFRRLGLRLDDYRAAGLDDDAIRELLAAHHLDVLELEHTWDWTDPAETGVEREMWHVARTIGFRQLNVPMFVEHDVDVLVPAFRRLCDRAAEAGIRVGLEFIPYSRIPTLPDAWRVVSEADSANGGLVIDLWHWFRSDASPADLVGVAPERIVAVQLCDVRAEPLADMTVEARHHRELPGRGAGDTAGALDALRAHGFDGPFTVEVFSDALDARPPRIAAELAFGAGVEVLTAGRTP